MNAYDWAPCFVDELQAIKTSALRTPLLPHQQRVVDKLQRDDQPGLVVAHGLGSGKTLTSIAAQDAMGAPATVVVPASLQQNYLKERKKHLAPGTQKPIELKTLQRVARGDGLVTKPLLIVDEAHRLRDPSTSSYRAIRKSEGNTKRLLLTGSPVYNNPHDIAQLVNVAANEQLLPADKAEFLQRFVEEVPIKPGLWNRLVHGQTAGVEERLNARTAPELKRTLNKYVDYHAGVEKNFPSVRQEDVRVPMTDRQMDVYNTVLRAAPSWVRAKIMSGLPPAKKEVSELNAFLAGARQVALSTAMHQVGKVEAPKIDRAFDDLQAALKGNERSKAVVYSNYLGAGLNPYVERLQQANIPFGMFRGDVRKSERDRLVNDYNDGKLRALLLSSAGGEGLDLKGTRLVQVLEPHWNEEKIHQVVGRAARYKSHDHLPDDERNVTVKHYLATTPKSLLQRWGWTSPDKSADEYLRVLGQKKTQLNEQFKSLLGGTPLLPHQQHVVDKLAADYKRVGSLEVRQDIPVLSRLPAEKTLDRALGKSPGLVPQGRRVRLAWNNPAAAVATAVAALLKESSWAPYFTDELGGLLGAVANVEGEKTSASKWKEMVASGLSIPARVRAKFKLEKSPYLALPVLRGGDKVRPLHVADYENDIARAWSGRHPVRADEVAIPARGTGEQVLNSSRHHTYSFRGNPIRVDPDEPAVAFATRHPDVAAAYGTGVASGPSTGFGARGSGRLLAYKDVPHSGDAPADLFKRPIGYSSGEKKHFGGPVGALHGEQEKAWRLGEGTAGRLEVASRAHPRVREYVGSLGKYSPTYEHVLDTSKLTAPVGEYSVRPARVGKSPAYAAKTLKGMPAEDVLKMGSVAKSEILYHGSPLKLDVLEPKDLHGDPRVKPAVFASPSRTFALAYVGDKWGDRDLEQATRGGKADRMLLREMRPKALSDIYGGRAGYLYHLPYDGFQALKGRRTSKEVVSYGAVTPVKVEEIKDALQALRETPHVELHEYDPKHPQTVAAIRRNIQRMREMDPETAAGYKKWRFERTPPELQELWAKEETKKE